MVHAAPPHFQGITPPVSYDPPTPSDLCEDRILYDYLTSRDDVFETDEGLRKRGAVITQLVELIKEWGKTVAQKKNIPEDIAMDAGGVQLKIFGSTRLGVHTPDADIDTLCVAPSFITRSDLFSSFVALLKERSEISMVSAIPEAYTPVLKFNINGQAIDMIFVSLGIESVPHDVDVLNFKYFKGLDEQGVRSLNGSRVAECIVRLVPNFQTFCMTLRIIKHWARQRGLYSNVLGFLGGVNYAILVAFVCQKFVNACPSTLVKKFFLTYTKWRWPHPIMLTGIEDRSPLESDGRYLPVWNPKVYPKDGLHLMPIITPAYPSMNSAYNVGLPQFRHLQAEFQRGQLVCQSKEPEPSADDSNGNGSKHFPWSLLCAPCVYDFFQRHCRYIQVDICADSAEDHRNWFGWVESRLRMLIIALEQPPFVFCHPQANCFHRREARESTKRSGGVCLPGKGERNSECSNGEYRGSPETKSKMNSDVDMMNHGGSSSNAEGGSTSGAGSIQDGMSDIRINDVDKGDKSVKMDVPHTEYSYISSFFIGLSFRNGLRSADITPSIQEFLSRVNAWDGKAPTMDLCVYPRTREEIPDFVFETKAEPSSIRACTPAKTLTSVNRNTDLQSPVFASRQNPIDSLTKATAKALRRGLANGMKGINEDDVDADEALDDVDETFKDYQTPKTTRRARGEGSNSASGGSESDYCDTDSIGDDCSFDPQYYNGPTSPEANGHFQRGNNSRFGDARMMISGTKRHDASAMDTEQGAATYSKNSESAGQRNPLDNPNIESAGQMEDFGSPLKRSRKTPPSSPATLVLPGSSGN
jgi:poly(A) polymerase